MLISTPQTAVRRPRRVAVGEFDGVHLGHVAVIADADTVLTFEPHPRAVVGPTGAPELLTTLAQKTDLIEALGVKELIVAEFNEEFSQMSPSEFVGEILVDALNAEEVRVGENFRFGRRAEGNSDTLKADSRFKTVVADLIGAEGALISSSAIRDLVRAGDVKSARAMLGHPFQMRGEVIHGAKRGRELGYPTANLLPVPGCVVPKNGVYAALANGRPAAASLGVRPTFDDGEDVVLEVFILDFAGDLYGQELSVDLLAHLRPELRFESLEELTDQMALDCEAAATVAAKQG